MSQQVLKILILLVFLVPLNGIFSSASAQAAAAGETNSDGSTNWFRTWFNLQRQQPARPRFQYQPTWYESVTGRNSGSSEEDCTQETYSARYNTPRRYPAQIPIEAAEDNGTGWWGRSPQSRDPRAQALAKAAERVAGRASGGRCFAGAKDSFLAAGLKFPGTANGRMEGLSAYMANRGFPKASDPTRMELLGFKKTNQSPANMQEGCVAVYSGGSHGHGHIEIKSTSGLYCSDFCSANPLNLERNRRHRFEVVYCLK